MGQAEIHGVIAGVAMAVSLIIVIAIRETGEMRPEDRVPGDKAMLCALLIAALSATGLAVAQMLNAVDWF